MENLSEVNVFTPILEKLDDCRCDAPECPNCDWCGCSEIFAVCCPNFKICQRCGGPCCCCFPCCAIKNEVQQCNSSRKDLIDSIQQDLGKVRGLSAGSFVVCDITFAGILEQLRRKQEHYRREFCGLRGAAFSNCSCMILWILFFVSLMLFLQFRFEDSINVSDPKIKEFLQSTSQYTHNFNLFFAAGAAVMCCVTLVVYSMGMWLYNISLRSVIYSVVDCVQDEIRMNCKESTQKDFVDFLARVKFYFELTSDFPQAVQQVCGSMHRAMDTLAESLDYNNRNSGCVRESIRQQMAIRKHFIVGSLYVVPCLLTLGVNIYLIYRVWSLWYNEHHYVQPSQYMEIYENPSRALYSEGLCYIFMSSASLLASWLWLLAVMGRVFQHCSIAFIFSKVRAATVAFANREILQVWYRCVIPGIYPLIKSYRKDAPLGATRQISPITTTAVTEQYYPKAQAYTPTFVSDNFHAPAPPRQVFDAHNHYEADDHYLAPFLPKGGPGSRHSPNNQASSPGYYSDGKDERQRTAHSLVIPSARSVRKPGFQSGTRSSTQEAAPSEIEFEYHK